MALGARRGAWWATLLLSLSCGRAVRDSGAANAEGNGGAAGSESAVSAGTENMAAAGSDSGGKSGGSGSSGASGSSGSGLGGASSAGQGGEDAPVGGSFTGSAGMSGSIGIELAPGQCAVERGCPAGGADNAGCTACLLHADRACGGPPPLPADCSSDAECKSIADNMICAERPCENAHCISGCLIAEDCEPSHDCRDYHCVPRACLEGTDCSANFRCQAGRCARRACSSSGECDGYCVLNQCQELAGHCAFTCQP